MIQILIKKYINEDVVLEQNYSMSNKSDIYINPELETYTQYIAQINSLPNFTEHSVHGFSDNIDLL